ncbi:MAG: hypothetical protein IH627_23805 [Rubrivivax sp.]|nr:hypothetical protein [Rubrivivax sp.]
MSHPALGRLIWLLIYGGLLLAGLGIFVMRHDAVLGWVLVVAGALETAAGVVLIWVRSRRKS